jgi:hypothetical protein
MYYFLLEILLLLFEREVDDTKLYKGGVTSCNFFYQNSS